jgi:hypothetical protein
LGFLTFLFFLFFLLFPFHDVAGAAAACNARHARPVADYGPKTFAVLAIFTALGIICPIVVSRW